VALQPLTERPQTAPEGEDAMPELSVLLVTDGLDLAAEVLTHLRAQTACERIELVLATTDRDLDADGRAELEGFHSVRVLGRRPGTPTPAGRAACLRAAAAPVVAMAETHCFPEPDWAEALIAAHRGPWAAVGPEILNENPECPASWANIYVDYAPWLDPAAGGPAADLPGHNSSYKRSLLLGFEEDELGELLEAESILHRELRARGHRLYVEPRARIHHRNITRLLPSMVEHFQNGHCFGGHRAAGWHPARRALYAAATPLIPLIRLRRIVRRLGQADRLGLLPGMLPILASSLVAHAAGELTGYLAGPGTSAARMAPYELERDRYAEGKRTG
jgi:hypothetical protein